MMTMNGGQLRSMTRHMAVALVSGCLMSAAIAADDISRAERLVFEGDHLRTLAAPTVLAYRVQRSGTMEPAFEDKAEIAITDAAGKRGAEVRCLTGARKIEMPALEEVSGNPIVLCFLERDIREMERMTGGKSGYFRKRIRMALSESAEVKEVEFDHQGRRIRGVDVSIAPYLDDPLRPRFERLANKRYLFRLSDSVPGHVVLVRAMVPDGQASGADAPASQLDERLELIR